MNHARQRDREIVREMARARARKTFAPVGPDAATQAAIRANYEPVRISAPVFHTRAEIKPPVYAPKRGYMSRVAPIATPTPARAPDFHERLAIADDYFMLGDGARGRAILWGE